MKKNKFSFKFYLVFFLALFFPLLFLNFQKITAGSEDNLSGWAWSENIGWISFNSTNCDSNGDGITDTGNYSQCPTGQSVGNYGVNIDSSTGIFSGYAWSEHIGWISFNEADLSGCPIAPCQAKLDLATNEVSGWAKALVDGGGWDGWIRLRGTNYGVSWNPSTKELEGWAFGDMVVGWISFNCNNPELPTPRCLNPYKVSANVNLPPIAQISCHPDGCSNPSGNCIGYTWSNFCLKNDSTDPDGIDDIKNSIWTIRSKTTGEIKDVSDCSLSGNPICNWTLPTTFSSGDYVAELSVEDQSGAINTTTTEFTILQDAIADFICSLTGEEGSWQNCANFRASEGEIVYFMDRSTGSEISPGVYSSIISRDWYFEDGTPSQNIDNATTTSSKFTKVDADSGTITLNITDSAGRTDSQSYQLWVTVPLPEWREIPPF